MQGFAPTVPKLYTSQTKLVDRKGNRLDQLGVFCQTPIKAGDFICAFTGTFMPKGEFDRKAKSNKAMRRHSVQLDFQNVDGQQEESQMLFVVPEGPAFGYLHVAQCLNEPPLGRQANAVFFQHQCLPDVNKEEYYHAVLVYAAYPIAAHSEIYLHYGDGYAEERKRNKYEAGDPAVWDEALRHNPPMDDVVEAILANGERLDEVLYKEGHDEEAEVVRNQGSRRRGNQQTDRLMF